MKNPKTNFYLVHPASRRDLPITGATAFMPIDLLTWPGMHVFPLY